MGACSRWGRVGRYEDEMSGRREYKMYGVAPKRGFFLSLHNHCSFLFACDENSELLSVTRSRMKLPGCGNRHLVHAAAPLPVLTRTASYHTRTDIHFAPPSILPFPKINAVTLFFLQTDSGLGSYNEPNPRLPGVASGHNNDPPRAATLCLDRRPPTSPAR